METVSGDLPKAWANAEAITKGEKAQITGIPELRNRVAVLASVTRSGILTCNVQKKRKDTEDRIPRSMMGDWTLNLKSALPCGVLDSE